MDCVLNFIGSGLNLVKDTTLEVADIVKDELIQAPAVLLDSICFAAIDLKDMGKGILAADGGMILNKITSIFIRGLFLLLFAMGTVGVGLGAVSLLVAPFSSAVCMIIGVGMMAYAISELNDM